MSLNKETRPNVISRKKCHLGLLNIPITEIKTRVSFDKKKYN